MVIILFVFFLNICNTSSLPTHLNKLCFSVRLLHHSPILFSYLWSAFSSVQCSAPYKPLTANAGVYLFLKKIKANFLMKIVIYFGMQHLS